MGIINLSKKRKNITPLEEKRMLDSRASYVAMEECLKVLELNEMPELKQLKKDMKKKLKEIGKITKDGK